MTGRLRNLADQATGDDPWYSPGFGEIRTKHPDEVRLIALAPDMARLLADMADWVEAMNRGTPSSQTRALLARFRELEERAG